MSGGGGGRAPAPAPAGPSPAESRLLGTQEEISRSLWEQYKQYGSPILSQLSGEATKPISEGAYAAETGRAGADVDQAYDRATTEFRGQLGRYGLNPGSGRFAGGLRSLALGRAADRAGAMSGARRNLRDRRRQLQFGTLSALSGQSGQALSGLSSAAGGYGAIANRDARAYGAAQQRRGDRQSGLGALVGTGLTAAATFFSDRRLKDDMGTVGKLDSGIPVHIFRYKDSPKVHMGVMADQAEKIRPEAVGRHKSGLAVVDYIKVAA